MNRNALLQHYIRKNIACSISVDDTLPFHHAVAAPDRQLITFKDKKPLRIVPFVLKFQ